MVSQSGGIGVMAHSRARRTFGLGFRVTISCGNEAALGVPDFIRALGAGRRHTRVIAVYTEGLSNPAAFVEALAEARRRDKPVVILKGGAHRGERARGAGAYRAARRRRPHLRRDLPRVRGDPRLLDRRSCLDVCLQLASLRPGPAAAGRSRAAVVVRRRLRRHLHRPVRPRGPRRAAARRRDTQQRVTPLLTPLSSRDQPDRPHAGHDDAARSIARSCRRRMRVLADAPGLDSWLFLAAGFGRLAPELVEICTTAPAVATAKPMCLTWQAAARGHHGRVWPRAASTRSPSMRARCARRPHRAPCATTCGHAIRQVARCADRRSDGAIVIARDGRSGRSSRSMSSRAFSKRPGFPVARGRIAATADEAVRAPRRKSAFPSRSRRSRRRSRIAPLRASLR